MKEDWKEILKKNKKIIFKYDRERTKDMLKVYLKMTKHIDTISCYCFSPQILHLIIVSFLPCSRTIVLALVQQPPVQNFVWCPRKQRKTNSSRIVVFSFTESRFLLMRYNRAIQFKFLYRIKSTSQKFYLFPAWRQKLEETAAAAHREFVRDARTRLAYFSHQVVP